MAQTGRRLWGIFRDTLLLSALTFGGGYVIVSLMRDRFVEKRHWLTEAEMLDITAIAQAAPGPIAVSGAILLGYRLAGLPGALAAIGGTVLPPLVILSLISAFYALFQTNVLVRGVLKGLQAGVAAVMADVVVSMGGGILRTKSPYAIAVMITAFLLVAVVKVNVVFVILGSVVLGGVSALVAVRRKRGR